MVNVAPVNVQSKQTFQPVFYDFMNNSGVQNRPSTSPTVQAEPNAQPQDSNQDLHTEPNKTAAAMQTPIVTSSHPVPNSGLQEGQNVIPIKITNGQDLFIKQGAPQTPSVKETLIKTGISLGATFLTLAIMMKAIPKMMNSALGSKNKQAQTVRIWEDLSVAKKINELALPETLKKTLEKTKNAIMSPDAMQKRGGKPVNSILLYGPPGTGKTTFAKALAKEFPDAEFASIDITKLTSKYHGETGKNINIAIDAICDKAAVNPEKKFFVFFDEIDSVMMVDDGPNGKLSNDILNEFKKCFSEKLGKHNNIVSIGATNLPIDVKRGMVMGGKSLDRPMLDRFEQKILVDLPTSEQIMQAITSHYEGCELVDSALKSANDPRMKTLCDFLAKKEHNVSFRTLSSLYNDTASTISGENVSVTFDDVIKTLSEKKAELKISDKEWEEFKASLLPKAA